MLLALRDTDIIALLVVGLLVAAVVALVVSSRRFLRRQGAIRRIADEALAGTDPWPEIEALAPSERALVVASAARVVVEETDEGDAVANAAALALARRALGEPDPDGAARVDVAKVFAMLGRIDDVRALVEPTPDVSPEALSALGLVAAGVDLLELAEPLLARACAARPTNLELVMNHATTLMALDRAGQAASILAAALVEVRRRYDALEFSGEDFTRLVSALEDMHEDAVRRSGTAEKVVDGMAQAGLLDARAGVNYRLMGHSLLVESTAPPRRVHVPSQAALRAAADEALAADARSVEGLTDRGLWLLREGELDAAEEPFQRALDGDPEAWPALLGLGATLDARHLPLARLVRDATGPRDLPLLARFVEPWAALTPDEQRLVVLSIAPFAQYLPRLLEAGGRLHVVSLDGRCTDLPEFAGAKGGVVEDEDDRRTHDAIEGMANGPVAAARIDTWYALDRDGCTVAHELGHAVHAVLDEAWCARVEALFEQAERAEHFSTTYGLTNPHEFFATAYERFVLRAALPDGPRAEQDAADRALGLDAFFQALARSSAGPDRAARRAGDG